jgi:hypothetical protein
MGKPVVLLADGSRTRGRVETELRKRYGADYRVIATGSAEEALEALGKLRDDQGQASLVLAGQWLQDATGSELLARVVEEEMARVRAEVGPEKFRRGRLAEAGKIFSRQCVARELDDFLTLDAYGLIVVHHPRAPASKL